RLECLGMDRARPPRAAPRVERGAARQVALIRSWFPVVYFRRWTILSRTAGSFCAPFMIERYSSTDRPWSVAPLVMAWCAWLTICSFWSLGALASFCSYESPMEATFLAAAATASSLWSGMFCGAVDVSGGLAEGPCCACATGAKKRPTLATAAAAQRQYSDFM